MREVVVTEFGLVFSVVLALTWSNFCVHYGDAFVGCRFGLNFRLFLMCGQGGIA